MKYVVYALCFLCIYVSSVQKILADDVLSQSLGEEFVDVTEAASPQSGTGETALSELEPPTLPQAENVDLKEVISEPLHETLQTLPSEKAPVAGLTNKHNESVSEEQLRGTGPESAQPIQLLGAEVLPGTATRLAWSAQNSLQGLSVATPVLVVHGSNPGPILCLTGAVHGDELNGIEVVRKVLYNLEPEKMSGSVIGVPIVNLQGFIRASRYLSDRRDLNRYFPGRPDGSSASRMAYSLFTQVIQRCDYLIDIHTGSFRRTNLAQLRADLLVPAVTEMTENLGSIVVLHSRGALGSLRRAAVEAGVVAVTIEAGEPLNITLDAVNDGVRSIEAFMHNIGIYPRPSWLWARQTKPVYFGSLWVRSSAGGILLNDIKLGERVLENQVMGVVTDPITNVATPILSPTDGQVIGMALNQVMLPGYAAYHIGHKTTIEEASRLDAGPDDYAGDDDELDLNVDAMKK